MYAIIKRSYESITRTAWLLTSETCLVCESVFVSAESGLMSVVQLIVINSGPVKWVLTQKLVW